MHLIRRFLIFSTILATEAFVPFTINPQLPTNRRNLVPRLSSNNNGNNNNESSSSSASILSKWKQKTATMIASGILCGATTLSPLLLPHLPAHAAESRVVGQIAGSGIVFKDTLQVESFADPKVRGVTLYISNFQRPITERFSSAKNFFSDPSSAAVACARTSAQIEIADNINKSPQGEEVFQESKSLLFKSLRVQRIYDEASNTVVYASFNTRFDKSDDDNKSRFQNSLCAVNLN